MTDEQDEYVVNMIWHADNLLDNHGHKPNLDQVLKLTEILMNHFPMPRISADIVDDGPKEPNAPGVWVYQAPGAANMGLVTVDGEGDKLDYYNEKTQRWTSVKMAQGQWGGRVK